MVFNNENLGQRANIDGALIPKYDVIDINGIAAASASQTIFIGHASDNYIVDSIRVVFGTASSSGTLQIEKATGTQAVASGTNLLTGTVSLAGAANTALAGTLIANPVTLTLTSGDRLNIILGGTLTSLANCCVTVYLRRAVTGVTS